MDTLDKTPAPLKRPPERMRYSHVLAMLLAASLPLAGCGDGNYDDPSGSGTPNIEQSNADATDDPANTELIVLAEPDIHELVARMLPISSDITNDTGDLGLAPETLVPETTLAAKATTRLVAAKNHSATSSAFRRLYGPGIFTQNALGNTIIGVTRSYERIVSNRFRAEVSAHLSSVRLYWQPGSGYSSGTGGRIRIRLMPDDGSSVHRPNMNATPLATGIFRPGTSATRAGRPIFADTTLSSKRALVAGRIYHLVLDNVDPAPHQNYISSNNAVTHVDNGRPSRWLAPSDWGTLLGMRPQSTTQTFEWSDMTTTDSRGNYYSPILQMKFHNGQSQGVSDMEGGSVDPKLVFTANSAKPVRERFTPGSTKRVTGFSVATAASVGGSLRWRIMQGNSELASGRITQSSANYRTLQSNGGYKVAGTKWYDVEFSASRVVTMQAWQSYDLEFHPEGSSQWKFADHRNGSQHGFSWPAAFTESHAQHRQNGTWQASYHWNYNQSRSDANWPVVLHLAP
ncbi:MAG: hypothetical protein Q4A16_07650 [Lautropia sp.]|nr:hypothetical protein [Lautropia sp.]